jgi:hypothetical protein
MHEDSGVNSLSDSSMRLSSVVLNCLRVYPFCIKNPHYRVFDLAIKVSIGGRTKIHTVKKSPILSVINLANQEQFYNTRPIDCRCNR